MSDLVIVESPAKAKTIKKYLGSNYEVVASMGHVRDLPKARLSVDIKNDFAPKYDIIKGKEKLVKELKSLAAESDSVYLATDPDREGEAISWHLAYILGLPEDYCQRVEFNEITKTGVQNGMAHPRKINQDLVNAQQARRVLDRLVGYKLSPFISQKIRRGLSAGRVQSVALRIIVDRENEIRKFKPEEYWTIDAKFIPKGSRKSFAASLYADQNGKLKITNQEQADKIEADLTDAQYCVLEFKKRKEGENFTVNKLQSIVSTSEPAVKAIEDKWYNTDAFREFANASSAQAVKTANEFYQTVSTQLSQDKFDLDTYQKSYSGDTAIKLSNSEKNYEAFVGTGLRSLKETADAEQNAKTLFEALKIAWTAYAFEVQ